MKNILKIALVLCLLPALMFALQRYASRRYLTTALGDDAQWRFTSTHGRFLAGGVAFDGEEEEPVSFTTAPLSIDVSFLLGELAQGQRTASRLPGQSDDGLLPPARLDQTPSGHARFDSTGRREIRRHLIPTKDFVSPVYLTVYHWGTREVVALAVGARNGDMARLERLFSAQDFDPASVILNLNEWRAHDRAWIWRGGWVVYATITAIAFFLLFRNMILRAARVSGRLAVAGGNKIGRTAEAVFDTTKAASQTINDTVNRLNRPPDQ